MTKKMRIFLIVCGGIVGLGILLSIIGYVLGGFGGLGRVEEKIPWISFGAGGSVEEKVYKTESFSSIDINCDIGEIQFIPADQYKVEYSYQSRDGKPEVKVDNGNLTVKGKENMRRVNFDILQGLNDKESQIKVYYPKKAELDNVKIKNDLGEIKIGKLQAKNLEVALSDGSVYLNHIDVGALDVSADLGDIEGRDVKTKKMEVHISTGDLKLSGAFAGTSKADIDLGDCTLTTSIPKEKYAVKASIDWGDCKIDGVANSGNYIQENEQADNRLELASGTGDITVDFL